jgi:hypothetical protein
VQRFLALAVACALSAVASGKDGQKPDRKVKWSDVVIVNTEPKGCEFIADVDTYGIRLVPFRTDKSMKKGQAKGLQKKAAKKGGNVAVVTYAEVNAFNASSEAKVYWCDEPPAEPANPPPNSLLGLLGLS